jgi:hypothetical protein
MKTEQKEQCVKDLRETVELLNSYLKTAKTLGLKVTLSSPDECVALGAIERRVEMKIIEEIVY